MEANRIWHEPVVEIYSNLITPGVCCSAAAYDLANRRWYQLNVGDPAMPDADWHHDRRLDEVPSDEWLSSVVEKHVNAYYHSKATPPPWNTISTNSSGSPVAFELTEETLARRPISKRFSYGYKPSDKLPTAKFKQLYKKTYLSRGADYCLWNDKKCVFKRIEFDCDVESHVNEIRSRETIIQSIEKSSRNAPECQNYMMKSRFNVVPILAVVLHDETSNWIISNQAANEDCLHDEDAEHHSHQIAGFLMPYLGPSLELLCTPVVGPNRPGSIDYTPAVDSPTIPNLSISEEQLLDLACGIQKLSKCGIVHGDISHWNVIITQPEPTTLQTPRLLLIDMGDVAPDYEGDMDALGNLFFWCLRHSAELKNTTATRERVMIAAVLLKGDCLNEAIGLLSPNKSKRGFKRPLSFANK